MTKLIAWRRRWIGGFAFGAKSRKSAHPLVTVVLLALLDDIPACAATLLIGDPDVDHC